MSTKLSDGLAKLRAVALEEFGWKRLPIGLLLAQMLVRLLPYGVAIRIRTHLYRLGGVSIGLGSAVMGPLRIWGSGHLTIGANTTINTPCAICLDASVNIGSGVLIGHDTVLATGDHHVGPPTRRGGDLIPQTITIEDGVWLGAQVLVLRGVTIGRGAIVGAGALVTTDVPSNALAVGVPARVVRLLTDDDVTQPGIADVGRSEPSSGSRSHFVDDSG